MVNTVMGSADENRTPLPLSRATLNSLSLRIEPSTVVIPEYHCRPCGSRRMHPGSQTHCRSKKMPKPKMAPKFHTRKWKWAPPRTHEFACNKPVATKPHVHGRNARNPEHARRPEHARSEACTREQGKREEIHPLKILRRHMDTGNIIAGNKTWGQTLSYQDCNCRPT